MIGDRTLKAKEKMDPSMVTIDSEFSSNLGIGRELTIRVLNINDETCILEISRLIIEITAAYEVETASSVECLPRCLNLVDVRLPRISHRRDDPDIVFQLESERRFPSSNKSNYN